MTVRDQSAQAHAFQLRIAIVDDDAFVRRALARLLRTHHLSEFDCARGLLDRVVADECFDVVVCDLMMPDLTGADLHAELEQFAPDQAARMMVVTGGATTKSTQAFLASTVVPVLLKPFATADVFELITRISKSGPASGRAGCNDSSS